MALSRINGPDELYVGGIFALRRPSVMQEKSITHILSMIQYSLVNWDEGFRDRYVHLSIDIDDVEDADMLVHLPKAVRFIDRALHPDDYAPLPRGTEGLAGQGGSTLDPDAITPAQAVSAESSPHLARAAIFVHCAMGKSRSVTAAIAYLLWKYPHRYGLNPRSSGRPNPETAREAVWQALRWVRATRGIAEPNPGFMNQLQMWVEIGMPADSDDAVEGNGTYQRWVWDREVRESANVGRAPDWLRFEDEAAGDGGPKQDGSDSEAGGTKTELRCKKCRRVLVTQQFIIPHHPGAGKPPCPHYFVEALSWMRPVLEGGALDGRLVCPNHKCVSSLGRYSWQGFRCSCGEWVCPAFSLQRSKVDEVTVRDPVGAGRVPGVDPRTALGIRLPPGAGARKQNL
ncbi:Tyrosine-protein phosphatase YVH1 [Pleurostoma richardsiae]|uniref:protein-tyrosine-phosphatase n=1 Tax=Pleurostoma richardsiae TaxID=41990 RepID=A0AA38RB15_9PEZI|nr:Tyrosine-protein phosphatase YVH1 [Pleurostoma richardsiae]